MSQTHTDPAADHDPLMAFSIEQGAEAVAPAAPATTQTAALTQFLPEESSDPAPASSTVRLDQLERSLEQSRAELEGLKSTVATLVSAIDDIKKRQNHRPRENPPPAAVVGPRRVPRTSAVAGVVLGLLLGVWIWTKLSNPYDATAKPPETTQSVAEEPIVSATVGGPAATVIPTAAIASPAPVPSIKGTAEPDSPRPRTTAAAAPTTYVGTLSIDSEPGGDVYIDRRRIGRTPQRVENLRAGSHLVWIEREGYQRYTGVVQVPANRVSRVSVALAPVAAR